MMEIIVCYSQLHCFKRKQIHGNILNVLSHVVCPLCDCAFDSEFCLRSHYEKCVSVGIVDFEGKKDISPCNLYFFCQKCHSVVRRFYYIDNRGKKKFHDCSSKYCKTCEVKRPLMHHCFLPSKKKDDIFYTKNFKEKCEIYVFDFETEANPINLGVLRPYFAAIYKFCHVSMDEYTRKLEYQCCTMDDWVYFEGENTDMSFGEYFLTIANKNFKSRWFAHNGSKFDTLFLLCYTVCEKKLIPKVVMNGFRILKLIYKNAEILDSMLLCPSSLKKVVEMLHLGDHIKKGYYPYDITNLNYVGPIPEKKYFSISKMDEKELKCYEEWYDRKKMSNYVLRNESKNIVKMTFLFWQKVY